jgi:hypothetical protein
LCQDRANFYIYPLKADSEDESDCIFNGSAERAIMQRFISAGSILTYAKKPSLMTIRC